MPGIPGRRDNDGAHDRINGSDSAIEVEAVIRSRANHRALEIGRIPGRAGCGSRREQNVIVDLRKDVRVLDGNRHGHGLARKVVGVRESRDRNCRDLRLHRLRHSQRQNQSQDKLFHFLISLSSKLKIRLPKLSKSKLRDAFIESLATTLKIDSLRQNWSMNLRYLR